MRSVNHDFALSREEEVPAGIRRIAIEELDYAIEQLSGSLQSKARDERIHEARKTIKRLRGLVRLARDEIGHEKYRLENDCFRQAAQPLAAAREAAAANEAFEALIERFRSEVPTADFGATRDRLRTLQVRAIERSLDSDAISDVTHWLEAVRGRVHDWPLVSMGWMAIQGGLWRVYAQGRKEYASARRLPSIEHLHEWRKRVKYHWFHVRLLRSCWPGPMNARRDELKALSDLLGDDHDLSELGTILLGNAGDPPVIDTKLARLLGLIESRRQELVAEAFGLGARLYAERPARLVERFGAYFRAWRASA
jgi:CHAD domain-containing protein